MQNNNPPAAPVPSSARPLTPRERAMIFDIDPNRLACREENAEQMRRRREREAAEAEPEIDAIFHTFGCRRPSFLLLNGVRV